MWSPHLENKHLSPEHSDSVKVSLTDVGPVVVWALCGVWLVWPPGRGYRGGLWWDGRPGVWLGRPARCDGRQGLGRGAVWWPCRKQNEFECLELGSNMLYLAVFYTKLYTLFFFFLRMLGQMVPGAFIKGPKVKPILAFEPTTFWSLCPNPLNHIPPQNKR